MTILDEWNHKWFGFWHEYGPDFERCPHVRDFVFPAVVSQYDKARLRDYFSKAHAFLATSRNRFPCPFTGKRVGGSICFRTDGEWLWLDDLPDYIEQFNVAIPSSWLRKIEVNGYVPPPSIERDIMKKLEWPPDFRLSPV